MKPLSGQPVSGDKETGCQQHPKDLRRTVGADNQSSAGAQVGCTRVDAKRRSPAEGTQPK
jgi:hypothetical protein